MKPEAISNPDSLYAVIRLVRPLYKALEASVAAELAESGLSVIQRAVLEQLHDRGPLTVPAIGRGLIAPRQFIQKTANELMQRGLVERHPNAAHKRSLLLALTPDGETAIAGVLARESAVMAPIAARLKAADVATAEAVMTDMIHAFHAHHARRAATDEGETT